MGGASSKKKPTSPILIRVTRVKSNDQRIDFAGGNSSTGQIGGANSKNRPPFPTPINVSMRSDRSEGRVIDFARGDPSTGQIGVASSKKRPPLLRPTRVSMRSDRSEGRVIDFAGGDPSTGHSKRRPPLLRPTRVSMKSDRSEGRVIDFAQVDSSTGQMGGASSNRRPPSPTPIRVSMKSDDSTDRPLSFAGGDSCTGWMGDAGSNSRPPSPTPTHVSMKSDKCIDRGFDFAGDSSTRQAQIKGGAVSNTSLFEEQCDSNEASRYQKMHKSHLQKKFRCLVEGIPQQGDTRLLHEIYTELYITGGWTGWVNNDHEVRQIEKAARGRPIKCSDIFKPLSEKDKPIRTVLTKGVAGIGKTVSVQKFILDWAEGKANQDVHFIFPLPFRELNLMKEKKLSLVDLIQYFFPHIKDPRVLTSSKHRVMFIFDGLDECRLPLDSRSNTKSCNLTELASVDVLLTNLIKGNLLPNALLWITTRPAAANRIPHECVSQVTEIRGFKDPQKEEYFRKRISDENLASRTITHLKSSRSLYIMCHIPVFCWISATVVESTSEESQKEMPRTLTQMYTRFLIIQTSIKKGKYTERKERDEEVIFKLGKLAFQQLEMGNLIFYEEDLRQCGIDVTEALVYSGVCTQIFREESGLSQGKVFSFVHLSIQEFLAALYVFLCFSNRQRYKPDRQQGSQLSALLRAATLHDLHNIAVDQALQSKNGHLDLFLRFLLGLLLESNQTLLRHLLPQSNSQSQSSEQTVQYVKQKIRNQSSSDRRINLFYCLNELNHHAVLEDINRSSGTLYVDMLLPGQWETKRFEFKMSEKQLAEFNLQKYIKTPEKDQTELLSPDEVLQRLVPVVTTATSAKLQRCNLTEKSGSYLASVLTSNSSRLRVLHLSLNELLGDSGVELLCSGLRHRNCKLEKLQLWNCNLTVKSCSYLATALVSSSVKALDLGLNDLSSSDVEQLCALVKDPHCKLETLIYHDGGRKKVVTKDS